VTTLDGARGKKQVWVPMFEPEVFRKQMYCIEVLVTLLGLLRPAVIRRPENCALAPRRYAPDYCAKRLVSTNHGT